MARRAHRRSQSLRIPAGPSIPALGRLRAGRGLTRCVVLALALCALALCALALAALFATPTMAQDGTPQPTACAGPDLTGAPGETVTLQGRCSTNPYGKWYRMAHAWKQLSGTEVTLSDASRGDPSFTIPSDAANGAKLEFRLTVTDQEGQTDSDTVVVTVDSTPEPTPPTACAGPDLTGEPGEVVRLEGICSVNPHGQWWRMAHLWTQPEGQNIVLSDATRGRPTFTVPADAARGTVYTFTLTVTDKDGESDSDSMTVTVPAAVVEPPVVENQAPAFGEGSETSRSLPENSPAGTNVGAAVTATDPDDDRLTYELSGKDAGAFDIDIDDDGQLTTIEGVTYDYETKSSYSLSVSASDGNGGTASIAVTVKLTDVYEPPPNRAPSFSASSATREVAENSPAGTSVGDAITATDPDGDKLTYSLSGDDAGAFAIDDDGQLTTIEGVTYDYETKSSYSLSVTASDPSGASASIAVTVKLTDVYEPPPNRAPAFSASSATREVAENSPAGTSVGDAVTATDPDDDKLTYALSGDDAGAFAIDDDGQLTTIEGVTYDYETKASYSLTVSARDGNGGTASIAITVKLTDVDETVPVAGTDYDADADDLIEVTSLAQLRAVFFDLNGDGAPEPTASAEFQAAYPDALPGMGCRIACAGYELAANLDFDSNGNGEADTGDAYWNGGAGWDPIGGGAVAYTGKFHGNGHTISNLYINRSGAAVGLFGRLGGSAYIHHVGLLDAGVTNAAQNAAGQTDTGALVGEIKSGAVVAASYATGSVSGGSQTGGLAGDNMGRIVAVWTEAAVSGTDTVGGIVGDNAGAVVASYAIGLATGGDSEWTKGVAGRTHSGGSVSNSYYNSDANPPAASGDPGGKTSVQLLEPTGYTGIYAGWNVDLDGDGAADDPWDFGGSGDYPLLKADRNGDGAFTWREFGSPEQPDFSVEGQTGDAPVLKVVVEKYSFLKNALGQELWNAYEPGARIFLRASTRGSTVPQGTPLTYAWEQVSGPDVTLNNTASSVANYVVPIEDPIWTTREFRLTVTGGGLTASYTKRSTTERYEPLGLAGLDSVTAPATTTVLQGSGTSFYVRPARLSHFWRQVSGPTVTWGRTDTTNVNNRRASFTVPADTPEGTVLTLRLSVTDPGGLSDYNFFHPRNHVDIAVRAPEVGSVTPATGCFIYLGELTAQLQYVGAWNDHSCSAHHSSGLARYFNFTLSQETQVSVRLSQGTLFISTGTPVRGWGSPPAKSVTHEDRNAKRMANGKLVHYGSNSATKTLSAGEYTVEASGWGVFNIIIKPGAAPTSSGSPPAANAGRDLSGGRGDTVTLRGTGSINPHGSWAQLQHQWAQLSGPTVTLTHPQTARYRQPASKFGDPRFVVPGTFADGTKLVFKLTVTDKDGETDSDTTTVTVSGN